MTDACAHIHTHGHTCAHAHIHAHIHTWAQVGLIDWGQVKVIGRSERLKLAKLLIALADRDQPLTAAMWAECGFRTRYGDRWCLDKWATWRFSRMSPEVTDVFGGVVNFEKQVSR